MTGIDILHDRHHIGAAPQQKAREIPPGREKVRRRDHRDGNLPGHRAAPHNHMAEDAGSPVLVVCGEAAPDRRAQGGGDDLVDPPVLQQTVPHGHDAVRMRLVNPAGQRAARRGGKRGDRLVPVVQRRFHAEDRLRAAKPPEQAFHRSLLAAKLLPVGNLQLRAAAAAPLLHRAAEPFGRFILLHPARPQIPPGPPRFRLSVSAGRCAVIFHTRAPPLFRAAARRERRRRPVIIIFHPPQKEKRGCKCSLSRFRQKNQGISVPRIPAAKPANPAGLPFVSAINLFSPEHKPPQESTQRRQMPSQSRNGTGQSPKTSILTASLPATCFEADMRVK